MDRHQILTGAVNNSNIAVSIGSVENNYFTAYGSGSNLVILSSSFDRVQIISGLKIHNSIINCIDCTFHTGKIAAAIYNKVYIFEPTPSAQKSTHKINYKWIEIGKIEVESIVECVSWRDDGINLLIGSSVGNLSIWSYNFIKYQFPETNDQFVKNQNFNKNQSVKFSITDEIESSNSKKIDLNETAESMKSCLFLQIWKKKLAKNVKYLKYSPDGCLFATIGNNDRLIKIWYQVQSSVENDSNQIDYDFIYLYHPRAVISFSWRQISKFMPSGMISNSLISCCSDNISRIWTQTVTFDYGLIQQQQPYFNNFIQNQENSDFNNHLENNYDEYISSNGKSGRQKRKLFNKLQKMRIYSHLPHFTGKNSNLNTQKTNYGSHINLSNLNLTQDQIYNKQILIKSNNHLGNFSSSMGGNISSYSNLENNLKKTTTGLKETQSFNEISSNNKNNSINFNNLKSSFQTSGFNFHLAGLIDPFSSNIPIHIIPSFRKKKPIKKNFIVHWMQNKDFHFTHLAEIISKEINQKLNNSLIENFNDKCVEQSIFYSEENLESFKLKNNTKTSNFSPLDINPDLIDNNFNDSAKNLLFGASIDQKLDQMLRDWYFSHDILFCIHPFDGSILIWLVDWLDEYLPGYGHRQAQISFHAKLPNIIPVGDSFSLLDSVFLFMDFPKKTISNYTDTKNIINMVTQHNNGTLNLWRLQFQNASKFQSLINTTFLKRVCGHRYQVNDIVSHPILSYFLTNSTIEIIKNVSEFEKIETKENQKLKSIEKSLIVWGVETVDNLSKTGGIYELARIDSLKPYSFENIAWFPCFLPSTTLGKFSSPSTIFSSTYSSCIKIFQLVFDAGNLLNDLNKNDSKKNKNFLKKDKKIYSQKLSQTSKTAEIHYNSFNIVSIQSTARPGCIIEAHNISDSEILNWAKADLFHIYPENQIVSIESKRYKKESVKNQFEEDFFLVFLEKREKNKKIHETIHMWKISIKILPISEDSKFNLANNENINQRYEGNRLIIKSEKVCFQELLFPDDVYIVCAASAASNLSSSALLTINKVPFLFSTVCSDGIVRFWSCKKKSKQKILDNQDNQNETFEFYELLMGFQTCSIDSQMKTQKCFPLSISCAYNGRFAVAYHIKNVNPNFDFCVKIFECESNGGYEWKLEDIIYLKDIVLQEINSGINFDYIFGNQQPIRPSKSTHSFKNIIFGSSNNNINHPNICNTNYLNFNTTNKLTSKNIFEQNCSNALFFIDNNFTESNNSPEIPSTATKISIKRQFSANRSNIYNDQCQSDAYKKNLIKLDWTSNENGSNLLTINLANKIYIFACENNNKQIYLNDSNNHDPNKIENKTNNKQILNNSYSKWIELKSFELESADDKLAIPTQIKWVKDGLLIIGLESEIHVYSQWISSDNDLTNKVENQNSSSSFEKFGKNYNKKSIFIPQNPSVYDLYKIKEIYKNDNFLFKNNFLKSNDKELKEEKFFEKKKELEIFQNNSLFSSAKKISSILPQYHPKQLFELINCGKINKVKAILMHLTKCLIGYELNKKYQISFKPSKFIDIGKEKLLEFQIFNNIEIPILPLYKLFETDDILKNSNSYYLASKKNNIFEANKYRTLNSSPESMNILESLNSEVNVDNTEDDFEKEQNLKKKIFFENLESNEYINFNQKVCKLLKDYLQYIHLSDLTSTEQLYLVALADTVVNIDCDINLEQIKNQPSSINFSNETRIVDDCGFKFLIAFRSYNYLIRSLSLHSREKLKTIGLGTANFVWAFHSECEQELLNHILNAANLDGSDSSVIIKDFLWKDLRQYGIGWWVKSPAILKSLMEKIAKYSFQQNTDPLDAALFYLAMKKKGVLLGLFRLVKDNKMCDFFKNDFTESKWQTVALKNAFVLLGKQRFEHAASFFLLAGKIKDAIEVCLRNLNDIQLALVVTRLFFDSNFDELNESIKYILNSEILNEKNLNQQTFKENTEKQMNTFKIKNYAQDPFLRSMSYWFLKDYKNALLTLFDINDYNYDSKINDIEHNDALNIFHSKELVISNVFNFYLFLKKHPLVLKHQQTELKLVMDNFSDSSLKKIPEFTSIERKLYFNTAYYHMMNGSPLLALDVLSRLPLNLKETQSNINLKNNIDSITEIQENSRIKNFLDISTKESPKHLNSQDIVRSSPFFNINSYDKSFGINPLEENLFSDTVHNEDDDIAITQNNILKKENTFFCQFQTLDIFAQQLKFICCLKILIEEMSNLASGFDIYGGQLRYYFYYWLEKETNLLKHLIFNENSSNELELIYSKNENENIQYFSNENSKKNLLHEHVLFDQNILQQKIKRLNKRKEWLRCNEFLLRTFLSYCNLHSSCKKGMPLIKMELILLMQELIEDKSTPIKKLYEPIPLQTIATIPFFCASLASSKNAFSAPLQMLKNLSNDIMLSIKSIEKVPTILDYPIIIPILKEASISLSSCIYQCLYDYESFSFSVKNENEADYDFSNLNIKNMVYKRIYLLKDDLKKDIFNNSINKNEIDVAKIQSNPKNWPGFIKLTNITEKSEDQVNIQLKILIYEALVSVFCSLIINALAFFDCSSIYKILSKEWNNEMWNELFGGNTFIEIKYKYKTTSSTSVDQSHKQRVKINAKLGHKLNPNSSTNFNNIENTVTSNSEENNFSEEKSFLREKYIPPVTSMVNFFLAGIDDNYNELYSNNDQDVDSETEIYRDLDENDSMEQEYLNPKSYSWCLMRCAILKLSLLNITSFLSNIGIEINEIAFLSPNIHEIIKLFESWIEQIKNDLEILHENGPPNIYKIFENKDSKIDFNINNDFFKLSQFQAIFDPEKTPFKNNNRTFDARQLWQFLISKKSLQEFFIDYIYKKKINNKENISVNILKNSNSQFEQTEPHSSHFIPTYKIIQKDQEAINSFCINEREKNIFAFCTNKEILEIDIAIIFNEKKMPILLNDYYENELYGSKTRNEEIYVLSDYISQNPNSLNNFNELASNTNNLVFNKNQLPNPTLQESNVVNLLMKRNLKEVKKLASHPTLPYYISGNNEGVVKLWHWGLSDPLSTIKQNEKSTSKITKLLFNSQGNKFCSSDVDGFLHLYQLLGCSFRPYLTLKCHKYINDFLFIESSSILLTVGTANDSYIVSLWDSLMPSNKSLIKSFKDSDITSGTCAAYSPINHLIYCGNKKGEINIYDIRMQKKLTKFVAHESSIKTIAIDSDEYFIATGSSEGNVKIWNLKSYELKYIFANEHSKSSLIRNFNSGVNQINFTNENQLITCGSDGSLVIRKLF